MKVINFKTEAETEAKVIKLTIEGTHFITTGRKELIIL